MEITNEDITNVIGINSEIAIYKIKDCLEYQIKKGVTQNKKEELVETVKQLWYD